MLNEVVSTQKPFGLRTFEKPSGKGDILLFANKSQGFIERAKITKNNHLIPKWKVLLSRQELYTLIKPIHFKDEFQNIPLKPTCDSS